MPPQTSSVLVIPAELIDHTIDHLHGDKQTLAACSLVCRDWLPSSRYHLFHTIRLTVDETEPARALKSFGHFLRGTHRLQSHVKELFLVGSHPEIVTSVDLEHLASLINELPSLRELNLIRVDWQRKSTQTEIPSLTSHSVRRLSFMYFHATPIHTPRYLRYIHHLFDLVYWFPDLQILDIRGACLRPFEQDFSSWDVARPLRPPHTMRLTSLHFDAPYSGLSLLDLLDHTESMNSLRSLYVGLTGFPDSVMKAGHVLRRVGPHLTHLGLGFAHPSQNMGSLLNYTTKLADELCLQSCTRLHTLHAVIPVYPGVQWIPPTGSPVWLHAIVDRICSRDFRALKVELQGYCHRLDVESAPSEWAVLEQCLVDHETLNRIEFSWCNADCDRITSQLVRRAFPRLHTSGKLHLLPHGLL